MTGGRLGQCDRGHADFNGSGGFLWTALKPGAKLGSLLRRHRSCITERHGLTQDGLGEDFVAVLPK